MDTLCQGGKVRIKRADYNARMLRCGLMQANEMPPIKREHNSLLCHGKRQDIGIRYRLPGSAALGSREDVMAEVPQSLHDWQGKVFVGIAPRHQSRRFIDLDLVLDLLLVRTGIGPRIG